MLEPRNTWFWYKTIIVICHDSNQQNQQLKWATLPTKVITVKRAFQLHVGNFVSSSSSNWNQVHENKNMWYHAWKIIMFIELKWIFTKDFWNHYWMLFFNVCVLPCDIITTYLHIRLMKFLNGISFAVHSFCMFMIMMLRQLLKNHGLNRNSYW